MKSFNLEEFKKGKLAMAEDGRKVRFLAEMNTDHPYNLACLVIFEDGKETTAQYNNKGKHRILRELNIVGMWERSITDSERLEYLMHHNLTVSPCYAEALSHFESGWFSVFDKNGKAKTKMYQNQRDAIDSLIRKEVP